MGPSVPSCSRPGVQGLPFKRGFPGEEKVRNQGGFALVAGCVDKPVTASLATGESPGSEGARVPQTHPSATLHLAACTGRLANVNLPRDGGSCSGSQVSGPPASGVPRGHVWGTHLRKACARFRWGVISRKSSTRRRSRLQGMGEPGCGGVPVHEDRCKVTSPKGLSQRLTSQVVGVPGAHGQGHSCGSQPVETPRPRQCSKPPLSLHSRPTHDPPRD